MDGLITCGWGHRRRWRDRRDKNLQQYGRDVPVIVDDINLCGWRDGCLRRDRRDKLQVRGARRVDWRNRHFALPDCRDESTTPAAMAAGRRMRGGWDRRGSSVAGRSNKGLKSWRGWARRSGTKCPHWQ